MSSMEPGTPARPARIAGFVLLGVAAIALIMGVTSLIINNTSSDAAPPSTTTSTAAPNTTSQTPPPASSTTTAAPSSTTTTQAPTSSTTTQAPPPPPPDGGGNQTPGVPVRVYNNSTIAHLASQVTDDLKKNGWNVTETGNYPNNIIPTTTVYFRPGTDEENAAKILAQRFHMRVEPRFEGIMSASPGVIVIATSDYQGQSTK